MDLKAFRRDRLNKSASNAGADLIIATLPSNMQYTGDHTGVVKSVLHRTQSYTLYVPGENYVLYALSLSEIPGLIECVGEDAAIFAYGPSVSEAMKAAEILEQKGVRAAVVGFLTVKPLDKDIVLHYASSGIPVFTVEEHVAAGGLGAAVSQEIATSGVAVTVDISAIPMGSKQTGPYEELVDFYGLSGEKLAERIKAGLRAPARLL